MCCVEFKVSTWLIWLIATKSFKSIIMSSTNLLIKSLSEITLSCWTLSCTEKLTLGSFSSFSRISTHTHPLSDWINFITGIFLTLIKVWWNEQSHDVWRFWVGLLIFINEYFSTFYQQEISICWALNLTTLQGIFSKDSWCDSTWWEKCSLHSCWEKWDFCWIFW